MSRVVCLARHQPFDWDGGPDVSFASRDRRHRGGRSLVPTTERSGATIRPERSTLHTTTSTEDSLSPCADCAVGPWMTPSNVSNACLTWTPTCLRSEHISAAIPQWRRSSRPILAFGCFAAGTFRGRGANRDRPAGDCRARPPVEWHARRSLPQHRQARSGR